MTNPTNLTTAVTQLFEAESNLRAAQAELLGLQSLGRVQNAQARLSREEQALQEQQRALQALQSQPNAPQSLIDAEQQRVQTLSTIRNVAQQDLNRAQTDVAQAQSNITVAQRQVNQAQDQVATAQTAPPRGQGTAPVSVVPPFVTDPPPAVQPITAGSPTPTDQANQFIGQTNASVRSAITRQPTPTDQANQFNAQTNRSVIGAITRAPEPTPSQLANQFNTQTNRSVIGAITRQPTPTDQANQFNARTNANIISAITGASTASSFKREAQQQATLQARYKEPSSQDWRVRLVLASGATYLYQDNDNAILKPLQDANGVIFPYTPQISTTYNASYDETQLTHSNYRGYFYKSSYVGDVNITATFTAQDTKEAQYLLAVIHFFRSVTKMFYGQDPNRGTPPPLVYLVGLGEYQFNGHPCLVSQFNYNLPADVDYIRATGFNNYGVNLLNRRSQTTQTFPGSSFLGSTARLLASRLFKFPGAEPARPSPGPVTGGVNNTVRSTYVPTKMEISLTLKPVQSRAQVSQEFSVKNFANGNLLKGGFW